MKKIRYYYSSMSKQVFLILLLLLVVARFTIFAEVVIFKINNYTSMYNIGATLLLYFSYLLICIFFFFGFKYFLTTYDDNEATYHNFILRKKNHADLNRIDRAVLNKRGIYLYYISEKNHCLFIPFFRLGIVSPVGIDEFYKLLKSKNIQIEKTFTALPSSEKSKKIVSAVYSGLALLTLGSLTQAVALATAILKSH